MLAHMQKRILFFLIFMGVSAVSFLIGSEIRPDAKDAADYVEKFNKLVDGLKDGNFALGIFFHNVKIALPMFLPGLGVGWGIFAAFSTGLAIAAFFVNEPTLAQIPPFTVLITPFGAMEIVAYSIGMSRSFLLIIKIMKKTLTKQDVKFTIIEIGMAAGLLLAAAFVEAFMIESAGMQPKIKFERIQ
ncbi:MAG: stage II sporulation protein M [Candidatus Nitrosotenuis sp.]|uniref:Stage II sporulation protein M n=2 Tax=Candidatus Nitrosotenuis uzonensis TaxID=1407055 RepID=A0A812EW76_9ARCH|nr:conserved membrane hypothetical protein [Candidatus Nitrosotenuis uzonensis]